jgi:rod shape-determining protein MreC
MFSKKTLMAVGLVALIATNIIALSVNSKRNFPSNGTGRVVIFFVAPFQDLFTRSIRFTGDVWNHYFFLASAAKENDRLKKALTHALEQNNKYKEMELANSRLRNLLNFKETVSQTLLAAEVVGKDPSSWFKSIIIDRGTDDGIKKGFPVVVSEGIVGQVIDVSSDYSKVLLIIDKNSAVDALVQRTRARGIIKGDLADRCHFKYVLRKNDIKVGDTVISSGLDGVYPKGFRIGQVSGVARFNSGIFQEVSVIPYVDFEKLEEVLVVLNPPKHDFGIK